MNFNRCMRCGCFFTTNDSVCPNCKTKDQYDMANIRNYLNINDTPSNIEKLAYDSGVSVKNLSRLLNDNELKDIKNIFK